MMIHVKSTFARYSNFSSFTCVYISHITVHNMLAK